MKEKDKVALETLRNIKKFFLEAKTAPGANDTLTDEAALKIIQKLVKQGKRFCRNLYRTGTSGFSRRGIRSGSRYGKVSSETDVR